MTARHALVFLAVTAVAVVVWRSPAATGPVPATRLAPLAPVAMASQAPYEHGVFAFTFEPRGFYRVPPHLRLVITEWLPCIDIGTLDASRTFDFAIDGSFTTDWRQVRTGVVALGGETVRNPNHIPVRGYGYFIDSEQVLTDREMANVILDSSDAVLARLEEMQTILARKSETQVEDNIIEILSRALHNSVVEQVRMNFQTDLKKMTDEARNQKPPAPPAAEPPSDGAGN